MKLAGYIKGRRQGEETHRIELDAMTDPLLGDALDGFDEVPGDHSAAIDRLADRIRLSSSTGRAARRAKASHLRERRVRGWSVAAAAVLVAGVIGGGVFLLKEGIPAGADRGNLAHQSGNTNTGGHGPWNEISIMPPVTVVEQQRRDSLDGALTEQRLRREAAVSARRINVVPDVRAEATDPSEVDFAELEIADFSEDRPMSAPEAAGTGETAAPPFAAAAPAPEVPAVPAASAASAVPAAKAPIADTTQTADFRRYVHELNIVRSAVFGRVTLSFEVSPEGRPVNVAVVESPSEMASGAAVEVLVEGPDWPAEPTLKLITINL